MGVWFDFDTMYNLKVIEGRFFSPDFTTDFNESCIINETAVKDMGLANPVGTALRAGETELKIIGVVKDFHYTSIHERIEPLCLLLGWSVDMVCIRLDPEHWTEALAFVESKFKEFIPNENFDFEVLEQNVRDLYADEARVRQIMKISSILVILISGMGLFGLSSFLIERRFKEIGIRKVHGASVSRIVLTFLSEFAKLVFIAIILAVPAGYYFSINWLDNFAYKTTLSWTLFLGAGIIVILIALLTVILQVYRASRKNPSDVLRYE
jgi:putative ABC transport system permease protein